MKKVLSLILAVLLLCSACGAKAETGSSVNAPSVEEGTFGDILWQEFKTFAEANPEATAEDAANIFGENEKVPFTMMLSPVDPAYFPGFNGEYKPEGFAAGHMFAPMIGSIPFVGYVFQMEEGADIPAFMQALTENANPSWNICVTADQTLAGSVGSLVLFVMCPESVE